MHTKKILYVVIAVVLSGLLFYMVLPFLDVVLFGILIYYLARPAYPLLVRILRSETIGALVSLFFLVLPLMLLFAYLVSIAFVEFESTFLPGTQAGIALNDEISILSEFSKTVSYEQLISLLIENQNMESMIIDAVSRGIIILLKIFLVFVIAYYLLKDGHKLRSWMSSPFLGESPETTEKFLNKVDLNLHSFFMGNILAAVITAVMGSILFIALDHFLMPPELSFGKYAILLGVVCGAANLIPNIGMSIVWIPLSIYFVIQAHASGILFDAWWIIILSVALIVVIVEWIPDMIVRPYVSGGNIHPGLMLLSYTFGAFAFGLTGLLLGPIIVILAVNLYQILPEVRKAGQSSGDS